MEEFCGSLFTSLNVLSVDPGLNPQEHAAKFLEFSKIAEDGPSRAAGLPQTFAELPKVSREVDGNPGSRLSTS